MEIGIVKFLICSIPLFNMIKLYVVRKYIKAKSIAEVLKKENKHKPDEIFFNDDWKKEVINRTDSAFGLVDEKKIK